MRLIAIVVSGIILGSVFSVWLYTIAAKLEMVSFSPEKYCSIQNQPVATLFYGFCHWGGGSTVGKEPELASNCIRKEHIAGFRRWLAVEKKVSPAWRPEMNENGCLAASDFDSLQQALD